MLSPEGAVNTGGTLFVCWTPPPNKPNLMKPLSHGSRETLSWFLSLVLIFVAWLCGFLLTILFASRRIALFVGFGAACGVATLALWSWARRRRPMIMVTNKAEREERRRRKKN